MRGALRGRQRPPSKVQNYGNLRHARISDLGKADRAIFAERRGESAVPRTADMFSVGLREELPMDAARARARIAEIRSAGGKVTADELDQLWAALPPVRPDQILGSWRGSEFVSGH